MNRRQFINVGALATAAMFALSEPLYSLRDHEKPAEFYSLIRFRNGYLELRCEDDGLWHRVQINDGVISFSV